MHDAQPHRVEEQVDGVHGLTVSHQIPLPKLKWWSGRRRARGTGREVPVNGRNVYVEESGQGAGLGGLRSGRGCGRTCWDPVVPLLADKARLVTYDRAGSGRSGRTSSSWASTTWPPTSSRWSRRSCRGEFVLVAHSMGGLVARRAARELGSRLRGLLLVDPTPETAPVYDRWDQTARKVDRMLAVTQALTRFGPLAGCSAATSDAVPGGHLPDHARRGLHPGRHRPDPQGDQGGSRRHPAVPRRAARGFRRARPSCCPHPARLRRGETSSSSRAPAPVRRKPARRAVRKRRLGHFIQAEQPGIVTDRLGQLLDGQARRAPGPCGGSPPPQASTARPLA